MLEFLPIIFFEQIYVFDRENDKFMYKKHINLIDYIKLFLV